MVDPIQKLFEELTKKVAEELTKKLADEGRLIEMGWLSLKLILERDGPLPEVQASEMRFAFMSGAHHLFISLMCMFDPDAEETPLDLDKMDKIDKELKLFQQELKSRREFAEMARKG